MRIVVVPILALLLGGCGNDPDRTDPGEFFSNLPAKRSDDVQTNDPGILARDGLAAIKSPLALAVLENRNAVALLVPYGENGQVTTWATIERQTVAVGGGRIVATRGLGQDLMSLEPMASGGASRMWILHTLNAANEPVEKVLVCRPEGAVAEKITLASGDTLMANRISESCTDTDTSVTNAFWISDNQVRQLRQWVGEGAGYLTFQVLRP